METPAPTTVTRSRRAWVLFVLALVVGSVAIAPYLLLDPASSRLEVTGELHHALLVAHVLAAMVALVLGPLPEQRPHRRPASPESSKPVWAAHARSR